MTDPTKPFLTYKLDLAKTLATKAADPYYQESIGLRVRELRVLRLVHDFPGIAATELGQKIVLDKTLLSKNIAHLEERGLIQRLPDKRDSRRQCLHLTDEGLRIWQESERIGRRLEDEMFAELSDDDWQKLHALLDRVLVSFEHWKDKQSGDE
jgi:DNA-binding MarR family transcriptional regulator